MGNNRNNNNPSNTLLGQITMMSNANNNNNNIDNTIVLNKNVNSRNKPGNRVGKVLSMEEKTRVAPDAN